MDGFDVLVAAARDARARAYAPYSHFPVGAAIQLADGRIFAGSNVESASYGLTMCAERVALFKAVSDGARSFSAVAVVADTDAPTPPCGACRQVLWEHCGDVPVVIANLHGIAAEIRLRDLLPLPFDGRLIQSTQG